MDTVGALQLVSSHLQVGDAYAELQRKCVRQTVLNCALKRTAKRRLATIQRTRRDVNELADQFERDFAVFEANATEQMVTQVTRGLAAVIVQELLSYLGSILRAPLSWLRGQDGIVAVFERINARFSATLPRSMGL